MKLINRNLLERLKRKTKGNQKLADSINKLIADILENEWKDQGEMFEIRQDADRVHPDGFFFFNINIHRTMILMEFDDEQKARVVWAGSHDEYERIFKNNKGTVQKWLRNNGWIN